MPRTNAILVSLLFSVALPGCADETATPVEQLSANNTCGTVALPLSSTAGAPTVTELTLDCESGGYLVPGVIITDPQGNSDLQNVVQLVQVYRDADCDGGVVELEDDVVASGEYEAFGTAVERTLEPELWDAICAGATWPVRIVARDAEGNETTGVVDAAVTK